MSTSPNNQNKKEEEGVLDFSNFNTPTTSVTEQTPVGNLIDTSEDVIEGGFIVSWTNKLFGNSINSPTGMRIVLIAITIILILVAISVYIFFGTVKKDPPKPIVPNPPPKSTNR